MAGSHCPQSDTGPPQPRHRHGVCTPNGLPVIAHPLNESPAAALLPARRGIHLMAQAGRPPPSYSHETQAPSRHHAHPRPVHHACVRYLRRLPGRPGRTARARHATRSSRRRLHVPHPTPAPCPEALTVVDRRWQWLTVARNRARSDGPSRSFFVRSSGLVSRLRSSPFPVAPARHR